MRLVGPFPPIRPVERAEPDESVRLFLPMLNGSDRVGVLAFTLPEVADDDRRLAGRLAGLVADMLVTKGHVHGHVLQRPQQQVDEFAGAAAVTAASPADDDDP